MIPITAIPPVTPVTVERVFAPAAQNWLPAHRGVDLAASRGQRVRAVRSGRIVFVGRIADRPVMVLRSRRVRFTFEPVRPRLEVGTWVRRGERIGKVGRGGHCDGRCLHWGAKVSGSYVDPMSFVLLPKPILKPLVKSRSAAATRAGPAVTCCGFG